MAAGHPLRGMATAGLVLITLETLAQSGTGRVGTFFADANGMLKRAFSASVPLIPDRRTTAPAAPTNTPNTVTVNNSKNPQPTPGSTSHLDTGRTPNLNPLGGGVR